MHSTRGYTAYTDSQIYNGGSRAIALKDELTEQEKNAYNQKLTELHSKKNFKGNIREFVLDFNQSKYYETDSTGKRVEKTQSLSSITFNVNQSYTYKTSGEAFPTVSLNSQFGSGQKSCFVSAALIELLLQLTNKMYIRGGQGTERGIVGSNFSALTADNNSVSDHAFGRGFDIMGLGQSPEQEIVLGSEGFVAKKQDYNTALDLLLKHLSTISHDLHPDLIMISSDLSAELGLNEKGLESADTAIRKKYPNIAPHVNFGSDSSHRNHIHISFGPHRAGSFITPEIAAELTGTGSTSSSSVALATSVEKFKKSYKDDLKTAFTADDIYRLLYDSGIWGAEASALFVGISERESGGWKPGALNGDRGSGDFSVGLFQMNLLPGAHGSKKFYLIYPTEEVVLGYKLAYSVDDDTNPQSLATKVQNEASRSTTDQRLFIPYNQAVMLAYVAIGEQASNAKIKKKERINNYVFTAWGDYKLKTGDSVIGTLAHVKYSTVRDVYISNNGGSKEKLDQWLIKVFAKTPGESYLSDWINGSVFNNNGQAV